MRLLRLSHSFLFASVGASLTSLFVSLTGQGETTAQHNIENLDLSPSVLGLSNVDDKRTVVVYTGPTELDDEIGKNWIYLANFDYFLDNGIQCGLGQDTIIVLSEEVHEFYRSRIEEIQKECQKKAPKGNHPVRVVHRLNRCYDMESLRMVFMEVDLSPYDYFVYLNCGIVGPKIPSEPTDPAPVVINNGSTVLHDHSTTTNASALETSESRVLAEDFVQPIWTHRYTSLLNDEVKMSGLTLNCAVHPHIQSMLFAVDRKGLEIIQKSGSIYDCDMTNEEMTRKARLKLIDKYEIGMSRSILEAGYGIEATHSTGITRVVPSDLPNISNKTCSDYWFPIPGRFKSWEDLMFFKSTRMFILPEIQDEVQYEDEEEFDIIIPNHLMGTVQKLWVGNVEGGDPFKLSVTVVISYCSHSLAWIEPYLLGFEDVKIVVVSKCGNPVNEQELPQGTTVIQLPNVGRCDHTMAYFMSRVASSIETTGIDVSNMAYVFLKDNYDLHQMARRRSFHEMLRIASADGFACFQEPAGGISQWHKTSILKRFNMTHYCGVPIIDEHGKERCRFSSNEFKSTAVNMGAWLNELGIKLPAPYSKVCYGGMYATMASRITEVPIPIWKKLEKSLRRADNIEEGHFAERLWAALLSKPLKSNEINLIKLLTTHINQKVAKDGGGHLGALITGSHSISQAWRRWQRRVRKKRER